VPLDKIWDIISDVDNDPQYWKGLSLIRNIRKEKNLVERSVKVGFMENEGHQIIKLNPKESVDLMMTNGPLRGSRQMKLCPSEDQKKTILSVEWDFQFSGVPIFARGFVKSQIEGVTKEALEKIARATEGSSSSKVVVVSSTR
jgi:hypothetical protein